MGWKPRSSVTRSSQRDALGGQAFQTCEDYKDSKSLREITKEDFDVFSTSGFEGEVKQLAGGVVRPAVWQNQNIFSLAKKSRFWKAEVNSPYYLFFKKLPHFGGENFICRWIWDFLKKTPLNPQNLNETEHFTSQKMQRKWLQDGKLPLRYCRGEEWRKQKTFKPPFPWLEN